VYAALGRGRGYRSGAWLLRGCFCSAGRGVGWGECHRIGVVVVVVVVFIAERSVTVVRRLKSAAERGADALQMLLMLLVVVMMMRRRQMDSRGRRICRRGRTAASRRAAEPCRDGGRRRRRVVLVLDQNLGPFVQLLPLHAPVLEPYLDLALAQVQLARDLPALLARDVRVADKLVLENHRLVARVRLPLFALSRQLCTYTAHQRNLKIQDSVRSPVKHGTMCSAWTGK